MIDHNSTAAHCMSEQLAIHATRLRYHHAEGFAPTRCFARLLHGTPVARILLFLAPKT